MSTPDHLASGQIPSTQTALFTGPSSGVTTISTMVLTNTGEDIITVSIYRNDGTARLLSTVKVPGGSGKTVLVSSIVNATLKATNTIEAVAGTASVINYQIDGIFTPS